MADRDDSLNKKVKNHRIYLLQAASYMNITNTHERTLKSNANIQTIMQNTYRFLRLVNGAKASR